MCQQKTSQDNLKPILQEYDPAVQKIVTNVLKATRESRSQSITRDDTIAIVRQIVSGTS
jgi:hypothetical protein